VRNVSSVPLMTPMRSAGRHSGSAVVPERVSWNSKDSLARMAEDAGYPGPFYLRSRPRPASTQALGHSSSSITVPVRAQREPGARSSDCGSYNLFHHTFPTATPRRSSAAKFGPAARCAAADRPFQKRANARMAGVADRRPTPG
jgi:hypothetical protein